MKKSLSAVALLSLLLAGGCVFTPNTYVENSEFDLKLPKQVKSAPIRLGVFKNLSGADQRFMVRRGDGRVVSLEYQRWRLSPELMLMRCMYGAFNVAAQNADGVPQVNAVIYRFEFDENAARLAVDFTIAVASIAAVGPTVRVNVAVPVKASGDSAAARAAAMSECVGLAVDKLAGALNAK